MFAAPRQNRVAFFLFESRALSTYPTITNAARLLAEAGYQVDIFLPEHMLCDLETPGVDLIVVSRDNSADYIRKTLRHVRNSRIGYDFYFAAYFEGLAAATLAQATGSTPIVYLSMELIYGDYARELDTILRNPSKRVYRRLAPVLRLVEITEAIWTRLPGFLAHPFRKLRDSQGVGRLASARFHRRVLDRVLAIARDAVIFSVVQDQPREAALRREFDFVDRTILLPNSYIGFDDDSSHFASERFGIPADKKIVLYSGAVERGFGRQFFELAREIGDEFVLFVNAYSRDGYLETLRGELAEDIRNGRLVLNETLLSDQEYAKLVKSSRICLAWYGPPDPGDENMYYLGLSSGKMNRYLACGRPVIVPDYYFGYERLMREAGIGIACSNVSELASAILKIEANYKDYRGRVRRFFEAELDFEKRFQEVLAELNKRVRLNRESEA
ncbi:MAG: hypothetical protein RIF32_01655 [Leptospirales bacterium]|jgi:hypothetical protein